MDGEAREGEEGDPTSSLARSPQVERVDTKAEAAAAAAAEKAGEESAASAAPPPQKHLSIPLSERERGRRGGEGAAGWGISIRRQQWPQRGVARRERERELVCVRVDGGRIELWETDGWGRVVC